MKSDTEHHAEPGTVRRLSGFVNERPPPIFHWSIRRYGRYATNTGNDLRRVAYSGARPRYSSKAEGNYVGTRALDVRGMLCRNETSPSSRPFPEGRKARLVVAELAVVDARRVESRCESLVCPVAGARLRG